MPTKVESPQDKPLDPLVDAVYIAELEEKVRRLQQELKKAQKQSQVTEEKSVVELPADDRAIAILYRPGINNHRNNRMFPYVVRKRLFDNSDEFDMVILKPYEVNWIPASTWKKVLDFPPNQKDLEEMSSRRVGDYIVLCTYIPENLKSAEEAITTKNFPDPVALILIENTRQKQWLELSQAQEARRNIQDKIKERLVAVRTEEANRSGLGLGGFNVIG